MGVTQHFLKLLNIRHIIFFLKLKPNWFLYTCWYWFACPIFVSTDHLHTQLITHTISQYNHRLNYYLFHISYHVKVCVKIMLWVLHWLCEGRVCFSQRFNGFLVNFEYNVVIYSALLMHYTLWLTKFYHYSYSLCRVLPPVTSIN